MKKTWSSRPLQCMAIRVLIFKKKFHGHHIYLSTVISEVVVVGEHTKGQWWGRLVQSITTCKASNSSCLTQTYPSHATMKGAMSRWAWNTQWHPTHPSFDRHSCIEVSTHTNNATSIAHKQPYQTQCALYDPPETYAAEQWIICDSPGTLPHDQDRQPKHLKHQTPDFARLGCSGANNGTISLRAGSNESWSRGNPKERLNTKIHAHMPMECGRVA